MPRLWRRACPAIGVPGVRAMRVGEMRVVKHDATTPRRYDGQSVPRPRQLALPLAVVASSRRGVALPILVERLRGTKFVSLEPKSVLNSPQQTGVENRKGDATTWRSEEHTSELQSHSDLVWRLL